MSDNTCKGVLENTEIEITRILNDGISHDNVDYLYKLTDIVKDWSNIKYWKEKLDIMRYRGNYSDSYGRRMRDSQGRYMDSEYGRRGVPGTGRGRYRGDDYLDDMYANYHDYSDSSSYGHEEASDKSFEYMIKAGMEFMDILDEEAKTPKQRELIDKFKREIAKR